MELTIECMPSRVQQPCKFIGTKESVYIRKELNSQKFWFSTPTWPLFYCFGKPIWLPWRHEPTLPNLVPRVSHLTAPWSGKMRDPGNEVLRSLVPAVPVLNYISMSFIILNTILISRLLIYTENSWNSMSDFIDKSIIISIKCEDYERNLLTSGDR